MSAARNTRTSRSSAKIANAAAPAAQTITLPTLSALFTPTLNSLSNNANKTNAPCNCGSCCQTSTTVCLTFDTTWLQNLVNIFPKIQVTNNNSCVDNDCEDCDDEAAGK